MALKGEKKKSVSLARITNMRVGVGRTTDGLKIDYV